MTKAELIEVIAKESDLTKAAAAKALEAYTTMAAKELKNNGKLGLVGFGTFSVVKRAARKVGILRLARPSRLLPKSRKISSLARNCRQSEIAGF